MVWANTKCDMIDGKIWEKRFYFTLSYRLKQPGILLLKRRYEKFLSNDFNRKFYNQHLLWLFPKVWTYLAPYSFPYDHSRQNALFIQLMEFDIYSNFEFLSPKPRLTVRHWLLSRFHWFWLKHFLLLKLSIAKTSKSEIYWLNAEWCASAINAYTLI